jgi:polyhydroxyalkanoate synthesis regulator phasin
MELQARDLFTLLATVQRLEEDLNARVAHVNKLVELLVAKGLLSQPDKQTLDQVLKEQVEVARRTEVAVNESEAPAAQRLPDELSKELESLGVLSQPKTLAESLTADFHELVERALQEFRREQRHGGGEAGTVADV